MMKIDWLEVVRSLFYLVIAFCAIVYDPPTTNPTTRPPETKSFTSFKIPALHPTTIASTNIYTPQYGADSICSSTSNTVEDGRESGDTPFAVHSKPAEFTAEVMNTTLPSSPIPSSTDPDPSTEYWIHGVFSLIAAVITARIALVVAGKVAWNKLPNWMKDGSHRIDEDEKDANDDLANPATLYVKIKNIMKTAYSLTEDLIPDDMPYYKLYCCFMSLVHLMNEIDIHEPQFREDYFSKDGVSVKKQEVETLLKYLEFADLAYNPNTFEVERELKAAGYKLISHNPATEPGCVGHFIAVDHSEKQVVVAIKGTSTLSDVLTDILGKAVPHGENKNSPEFRCHEGMYTASQLMVESTDHLLESLFLPLGYKIVITGHSLGAGVSCLLGMFFKEKFPDMSLQVYAFATPACCSYEAALSCKDYITSIVNNNDCVPRMSLMNVRMMNKLFIFMDDELGKRNMSPNDFKSVKNLLKDLIRTDSDFLVTTKELSAWMEIQFSEPRDKSERFLEMELYVPGRVVSVWNHTKEEGVVRGKVTHGYSQVLRQIFIEPNMLSNHGCDSYRSNLKILLENSINDEEEVVYVWRKIACRRSTEREEEEKEVPYA